MDGSAMDCSYLFQMDESYFIIPSKGQSSILPQTSLKELAKRSEFLFDVVYNHRDASNLCSTCTKDLNEFVEKEYENLQNQIRAYDLAVVNFRQNVPEDPPEIESIEKKLQEVKLSTDNALKISAAYAAQLKQLQIDSNETMLAIEEEMRQVNILEYQAARNRLDLLYELELIDSSLHEINFFSEITSTNNASVNNQPSVLSTGLAPLFDIYKYKGVNIINGFRVAYYPSPQFNLSWSEINFSWSLVSQAILCLRQKHNFPVDLEFIIKGSYFTQNFNDAVYFYNSNHEEKIEAPSAKSQKQQKPTHVDSNDLKVGDELQASRILRMRPLRHRCILYLRDIVSSPSCNNSDKASDVHSEKLMNNSSNNSSMQSINLNEGLEALKLATADIKSNSLRADQTSSTRFYDMEHSYFLEGGDDDSKYHVASNVITYQIGLTLLAITLVCTAIDMNCAEIVIPNNSMMYAMLMCLKPSTAAPKPTASLADNTLNKTMESSTAQENSSPRTSRKSASHVYISNYDNDKLFKFIDWSQTISAESDDSEEEDDNNFSSVLINRGRSVTDMNTLVDEIFSTLAALTSA